MSDHVHNNQQHGNEDSDAGEPRRKQQKFNEDDDEVSEPVSFTNICNEMVDRIFDFLDAENLLMVAGTCKKLQTAAIAKYRQKYGQKRVDLALLPIGRMYGIDGIETASEIRVFGLKFHLPFLRIFGAGFSTLSIGSGRGVSLEHENYVDQYVNQYCVNTLTSIRFTQKSSFFIDNFANPFTNVKEVYIGHLQLGQHLPLIRNAFPNVNDLFMYDVSIDEQFMAVSFPKLEELSINGYKNFTMRGMLALLHANLQLKCFWLYANEPLLLNEILDMIAENPSITSLRFESGSDCLVDTIDLWRLSIERPSIVSLDLKQHLMDVPDVIMFIRQQQSLQRICFKTFDQTDYDRLKDALGDEWQFYPNLNGNYKFLTLTR